ncbi:hypothetical protein MBANPS3_004956 [Mucor bainieri]
MQTPNDDILSPDYSNPLQYFSSQSLSRTTPPIYADDPWTTSSNASFDFTHDASTSSNNYAVDSSFMMEPELNDQDAGFGTELTANNVLLGADVPEAYFDIYSKSNPRHERIDARSLQIILHLAGIPVFQQQKVSMMIYHTPFKCEEVAHEEKRK